MSIPVAYVQGPALVNVAAQLAIAKETERNRQNQAAHKRKKLAQRECKPMHLVRWEREQREEHGTLLAEPTRLAAVRPRQEEEAPYSVVNVVELGVAGFCDGRVRIAKLGLDGRLEPDLRDAKLVPIVRIAKLELPSVLHAVLRECLHEVTGLKADACGGRLHDGIDGARVVALGWAFARLGRRMARELPSIRRRRRLGVWLSRVVGVTEIAICVWSVGRLAGVRAG